MAAALAPGETTIVNAACEPHVQDLCRFLVSLGARIDGHRLERAPASQGVDAPARRRATGSARSTSRSASFIGLAAVTGGDITIEDAAPDDLVSIIPAFERLGVRVELGDDVGARAAEPGARDPATTSAARSRRSRTARGPRSRPTSRRSRVAVATQARGTILIFEKMFENRLFFVDKLVSMGARIILCDPHRVVVIGPARLYGAADVEPGHPRRHGARDREPLRRGHLDDRQRRARSTAATSGSTSACARSARRSSASS